MEKISEDKVVFLDKYVDTALFDAYGSRAVYSIFVKDKSKLNDVYSALAKVPNIDVYKRDQIPDYLHYKNNDRVGDMIIATNIGYTTYVRTQDIDWTQNSKYCLCIEKESVLKYSSLATEKCQLYQR